MTDDGQESQSTPMVVDLKEDIPDAVEMMLLYLYTLELPDTDTYGVKEYVIGDKYALSKLRDHGKCKLLNAIRITLPFFGKVPTTKKTGLIGVIKRTWAWTMTGSDELRQAILDALLKSPMSFVEHDEFFLFQRENEDFQRAFLKALAGKAAQAE